MKILTNFSLFLLSFIAISCDNLSAKKEIRVNEQQYYKLVDVVMLQPHKDIVIPGDLKPYYQTKIFPKVKGFIKTVLVDRGSHVRKGQILASIEAPELDAQFAEAFAKIEQSASNLAASLTLYRRLLQTNKTAGAISAQELDTVHSKVVADSANVSAAKANANN